MVNKERVELRCHTNFSLLNGVSSVKKLIDRSKSIGINALAITDEMSVCVYPYISNNNYRNSFKIIYGIELCLNESITILAKNRNGIRAIYEIISYLKSENLKDNVFEVLDKINAFRNDILIGSGSTIFKLINGSINRLKFAEYFDYIEIDLNTNQKIVEQIIQISEEINIPAVAVGNVRYADSDDKLLYDIITDSSAIDCNLSLLSTQEMLKHFNYLPAELANKIVVENSNLIAEKISNDIVIFNFAPIYLNKTKYFFEIRRNCFNAINNKYGKNSLSKVFDRLRKELKIIENTDNVILFYTAMKICELAEKKGQFTSMRGPTISSLIAYLLNISDVDPIENDISIESVFGVNGEKRIDMDISLSHTFRDEAIKKLQEIFGNDNVITTATRTTISYLSSIEYIEKYEKKNAITFNDDEFDLIAERLSDSDITCGIQPYPVKYLLIPNHNSALDFIPVEHKNGQFKTLFEFKSFYDKLITFNIYTDIPFPMYKYLFDETGINPMTVDYKDAKVIELFQKCDIVGLPNFDNELCRQLLKYCKPKSFDELVKINGLCHSTNGWTDNAEHLLKNNVCTLADIVSSREDVFNYLVNWGVDREIAFFVMELVRKGIAKSVAENFIRDLQSDFDLPDWWVESVFKVSYLWTKGSAVNRVQSAMRLAWFKVYYPKAFYKVALSAFEESKFFDVVSLLKDEIKAKGICL